MFDLVAKSVYDWRNLFILLSLEKVEPYLSEIEFPLVSHIGELREIAKEFVPALDNLEPNVFIREEVSPQANSLFAETYQKLVSQLGELETELLLGWGKDVLLEHEAKVTIFVYHNELRKLIAQANSTRPKLSDEKLAWLFEVVRVYLNNVQVMLEVVKQLDQSAKDLWEKQAFSIYNFHEDSKEDVSPYDILLEIFDFTDLRKLLSKIQIESVRLGV